MTRIKILFLIILVTVSAACGSDKKPASDEAGFIKAMETEFPGSNKEHNLDNGKNVCFKLRSGMTEEEVIMEKFEHGLTIANAGTILKLSTQYLCKDFG